MKKDTRKLLRVEEIQIATRRGVPKDFVRKIFHFECLFCKNDFTLPLKRYNQGIGKYCSNKCQTNDSKGERNGNYKHGKQNGFSEWWKIRDKLFVEKGQKCELCGFDKFPDIIEAHHKLPKTQGGKNTEDNCLLICPNCHKLIHRGIIGTDGNTNKNKGKGIHNF